MKNDSELQRIRADLNKAKIRAADLRGTPPPTVEANAEHGGLGQPLAWHAAKGTAGMANGDRQWHSQLAARTADIARLEAELVQAMLAEGKTTPAVILYALEHVCAPVQRAAPEPEDDLRGKLRALLDRPALRNVFGVAADVRRSALEALLAEGPKA